MDELKALKAIIKAWDSLPGGRKYEAAEIGEWLVTKMSPAINKGRAVLKTKQQGN